MNKTFIFILTALCYNLSFSQDISPEILSTAGTSYDGSTIQLDWTLGELMIETSSGSTSQITQGFHQAYFTRTSMEELSPEIGTINIFPNPTTDWFYVDMSFQQRTQIELILLDQSGRCILSKKEHGSAFRLQESIEALPTGFYLLTIRIDNQYQQSFKIQKT